MVNAISHDDYKKLLAAGQKYVAQKQAADPEWQAWQQLSAVTSAENRDQLPPAPNKDYWAEFMGTLTPQQAQGFQQNMADSSSWTDKVGGVLRYAIPAAVGGAGLAAAGAFGPMAQGFVGGAPLGSGLAAAPAVGSSVGFGAPEAMGYMGTEGALSGAGTITGGSGTMLPGLGGTGSGLGVPGLSSSIIPGVKSAVDAGSLLTGLGQYAPLITAGLGVANSVFGGPDMPNSPNYNALLAQQTAAQNALYDKQIQDSRVNTTGPGGNQTWQKDANGQWTLATTLSPEQQGLYNSQSAMSQGLINNAQQATANPLDFSSAPALMDGSMDGSGNPNYIQSIADALYSKNTRYLDPQMQQDQRTLESRLGEQGFVPGTPQYNQAMQNFMDTKNRAYGAARDYATTQGFTSGLANAQFNNTARGQSIAEILAKRNQPLNELNAFKTGNQVQTPQGNVQYSTPQQQSPDVIGTGTQGYNAALGQYNAGTAQANNTTNNLFGLSGLLMNGQYDNGVYKPKAGDKYNLFTGLGGH